MTEWHDIASAPIGEDILLFVPQNDSVVVIGHKFSAEDGDNDWYPQHESQFKGGPYAAAPTHWAPLPSPPKAGQ